MTTINIALRTLVLLALIGLGCNSPVSINASSTALSLASTCVAPLPTSVLKVEACKDHADVAVCHWTDRKPGRVTGCSSDGVTCIDQCPPTQADACPSYGTCFPPAAGGVCTPAWYEFSSCPNDPTKATCVWHEGIPFGSTLQQYGCSPETGIECVESCT